MRTIDLILKKEGFTKEQLKEYEKKGICNGCGGKGGISFDNLMRALPYFREEKGKQLMEDLHLVCNIHDICFNKGGGIKEFIKCNYRFAINVCKLIHWTKTISRIAVFLVIFIALNIFGKKYFNWGSKR